MRVNLQAESGEDKLPAGMSTAELFDAKASRAEAIRVLRAEAQDLHDEITRREHAEAAAKRNPDRSLDQGIDLRLDMPGGR